MNLKVAIADHLELAKLQADGRDRAFKLEMDQMQTFKSEMTTHLRQASMTEYLIWLEFRYKIFGSNGFMVIRTLPDFCLATGDITIYPLMGALSLNIIIPTGTRIMVNGGVGHNNLYLPDGRVNPNHAPVYISDQLLKLL